MEIRHLRYFVAVAGTLNFTRAAAKLRIAQPALSRQVQDLENEIGVDLLIRSSRGVTLTAEGKLFLEEATDLLARSNAAVEKVRALARGETGILQIGYSPSPTVELLPPALAAFQRTVPGANIRLHDLGGNELVEGVRTGRLELAVMQRPWRENASGLHFEKLLSYPMCVAVSPRHAWTRRKSVPLTLLQTEKLVVFSRHEYADYHHLLTEIFANETGLPPFAVECDGASSLITEVEAGRGVAVLTHVLSVVAGARLKFISLTPTPAPLDVGVCRSEKGNVTPAGERFCECLRRAASNSAGYSDYS